MSNLISDLKFAIRTLLKSPGFAAVAVITLALGIGLNSAIFSVVNAMLFRPLPYDHADRIVTLHTQSIETGKIHRFSYPGFEDYRDRQTTFEHVVAWSTEPVSMGRGDVAEVRISELVSGDYFEALGVKPILGRFFSKADDQTPRAHPVIVMGHTCWQRSFNADPDIVGTTLAINNYDFTIIGVAPEGFGGIVPTIEPDIWVPMMMQPLIDHADGVLEQYGATWMDTFGVLKPGVSLAEANAELEMIAAQLRQSNPDWFEDENAFALATSGMVFDPENRPQMQAMAALIMLMVGLILLIACANVANLLLARSTTRKREIAIRLALGSTRGRLVRQLLCEAVILALAGGLVGLLVATWSLNLVPLLLPELPMNITINLDFGLDIRVMAFALGISTLTGIIFGLVPAIQAARADLIPALKDEGASSTRFKRSRLRSSLVVGQVAISLVLLIASGLFVRSLIEAKAIDPGFAHENTIAMMLDFDRHQYEEENGRAFCNNLLAQVRELPGIESASLDRCVPLGFNSTRNSFHLEGDQPEGEDGEPPYRVVGLSTVSSDDFRTLGIPLLMGRDFNQQDIKDGTGVIIVNQTFAEKYWPGENPLGKRISLQELDGPFMEVVGVVKTVKYDSIGEEATPYIYRSLSQYWSRSLTLLVRTSGDPTSLIAPLRGVIRNVDPNFAVSDTRTLTNLISFALLPAKFAAGLFSLFGVLALLLATVGLYGVMSYMVSQRTHEIGIRMAIGADKSDVLRLIMKQGLTLTAFGLGIGLVIALGFTRVLKSLLYDVSPSDPLTFGAIALLLAIVAMLATLIPARRAMNVDPMVALRYE